MKMHKINWKQSTAMGIATVMTVLQVTELNVQAAPPAVLVDETAYINLDYYGGIEEVNIVKGCTLNGNTKITDYGNYENVVNMTNNVKPTIENGKVIWDLSGHDEDRFYFECRSDELAKELPWNIDVSYRLNGKECKAEELAGAEGMVTLLINVDPNEKADAYYQNNMILSAAVLVDMDKDNYSLEAPGAQLQTMGTKKMVLFMALPGETGDFRIDIGTKSFENTGVMFVMMPATLSSLDRISDIREVKDTVRDSMDAMSDSADVILDNLVLMKEGLEETQTGLRAAQEAKKTYDAGKDQVKSDADAAIDSLDGIRDSLMLLSAQTAIEKADYIDAMEQLETIRQSIYEMDEYLEDMEEASGDLEDSMKKLRHKMKDGLGETEEDVEDAIEELLDIYRDTGDETDKGNLQIGAEVGYLANFAGVITRGTIPVLEDTEGVVHELENLLAKASEVINEGYSLGGHMTQDYKDHILMLLDETQQFIDSSTMSVVAVQQSLRSMRALMDATEDSLDTAIDSSLSGMIGIVNSGIGIAGGSETFRNAKNVMKDAVDDELDELEEDSNILEIDTSEAFPSFTSAKNAAPQSIQVIMRTAEISIDDDVDYSVDIERAAADVGIWGRIKAVFAEIKSWFVK